MPLLVSGSRDSKVKFWCIEPDLAKTSCCKTLDYSTELDSRPGLVTSIEFGPNHQNGTDSLLATGTFSGMLRLYDIENLRPLLRGKNPFYLTPTKTDIHRLYSEIGPENRTKVLPGFGSSGGNNTKRNRHKLSRKRRRRTFRKKRKSHNRR